MAFCKPKNINRELQRELENHVFHSAELNITIDRSENNEIGSITVPYNDENYVFTLNTEIGSGTVGKVYRFENKEHRVAFAVKIVNMPLFSDLKGTPLFPHNLYEDFKQKTVQNNCNVLQCRLIDHFVHDDAFGSQRVERVFLMELADGDLNQLKEKNVVISRENLLRIAESLRRQMVCLFYLNPAFMYTDVKLDNLFYNCVDGSVNEIRVYFGDLDSVVPTQVRIKKDLYYNYPHTFNAPENPNSYFEVSDVISDENKLERSRFLSFYIGMILLCLTVFLQTPETKEHYKSYTYAYIPREAIFPHGIIIDWEQFAIASNFKTVKDKQVIRDYLNNCYNLPFGAYIADKPEDRPSIDTPLHDSIAPIHITHDGPSKQLEFVASLQNSIPIEMEPLNTLSKRLLLYTIVHEPTEPPTKYLEIFKQLSNPAANVETQVQQPILFPAPLFAPASSPGAPLFAPGPASSPVVPAAPVSSPAPPLFAPGAPGQKTTKATKTRRGQRKGSIQSQNATPWDVPSQVAAYLATNNADDAIYYLLKHFGKNNYNDEEAKKWIEIPNLVTSMAERLISGEIHLQSRAAMSFATLLQKLAPKDRAYKTEWNILPSLVQVIQNKIDDRNAALLVEFVVHSISLLLELDENVNVLKDNSELSLALLNLYVLPNLEGCNPNCKKYTSEALDKLGLKDPQNLIQIMNRENSTPSLIESAVRMLANLAKYHENKLRLLQKQNDVFHCLKKVLENKNNTSAAVTSTVLTLMHLTLEKQFHAQMIAENVVSSVLNALARTGCGPVDQFWCNENAVIIINNLALQPSNCALLLQVSEPSVPLFLLQLLKQPEQLNSVVLQNILGIWNLFTKQNEYKINLVDEGYGDLVPTLMTFIKMKNVANAAASVLLWLTSSLANMKKMLSDQVPAAIDSLLQEEMITADIKNILGQVKGRLEGNLPNQLQEKLASLKSEMLGFTNKRYEQLFDWVTSSVQNFERESDSLLQLSLIEKVMRLYNGGSGVANKLELTANTLDEVFQCVNNMLGAAANKTEKTEIMEKLVYFGLARGLCLLLRSGWGGAYRFRTFLTGLINTAANNGKEEHRRWFADLLTDLTAQCGQTSTFSPSGCQDALNISYNIMGIIAKLVYVLSNAKAQLPLANAPFKFTVLPESPEILVQQLEGLKIGYVSAIR